MTIAFRYRMSMQFHLKAISELLTCINTYAALLILSNLV